MTMNESRIGGVAPLVRTRGDSAYLPFALYVFCLWLPAPLDLFGTGATAGYFILLAAVLVLFFGSGELRLLKWPRQEAALFAFLFWSMAFLMVWSLLSAFQAESIVRVGRPMATDAQAILTILLMRATLRDFKAQMRFADMMVWISIGMSAYVVAAVWIEPLRLPMWGYGDRIPAFFKHPNQLGIVLAMFFPVLMARTSMQGFRNPVSLVGAGLVLLALFASGSKTNVLLAGMTGIVALAITPFLHRNGLLRMGGITANAIVGSVAIIAAIAALAVFNPRASGVLSGLFSGNVEVSGNRAYGTIAARDDLWSDSIKTGMENPLFGEGAGQEHTSTSSSTPHSHNAIIDAFRTLGIPGAAVTTLLIFVLGAYFCLYILNLLRRSIQPPELRAIHIGIALGGLSYLMANQMSDSFGPSTSPFLWLFTGQLMVSARYFFYRD